LQAGRILTNFLRDHKTETVHMLFAEYNMKDAFVTIKGADPPHIYVYRKRAAPFVNFLIF